MSVWRNAVKVGVVIVAMLAIAAGCKSSDAAQPGPSSTGGGAAVDESRGDAGGSAQARLMAALRDYQLPAQSVPPPARHADPQVDGVIQKMMAVAAQQGLIYDGSRAAEGIVVVGRPGKSGKPMLVAVAVYPKAGRVAMQDAATANGSDYADAERMKERFVGAL